MLRLNGRFHWRIWKPSKKIYSNFLFSWENLKVCFHSLTYNHHMNMNYASDVCMEPIFWFVDNYTHLLGPFLVAGVIFLTTSVVSIAYWIGVPYYQEHHPNLILPLIIVGNWLLINVVYHYYKAVKTPPGFPPEDSLIPEAVSICKKCILPKPPRTHHCSVCNKCILKMDHHCPWLNNCVGYGNHRFFFLYMAFTVVGCIFLVIFGIEIAYFYIWLGVGDSWTETEPLEGHPVTYNDTGHMVPAPILEQYDDAAMQIQPDLPVPPEEALNSTKRKAVIYVALIVASVILALGSLTIWHSLLITRGETSIESHINQSETKRFKEFNMEYINPYNFGKRKNWILFLGLVKGRTFLRHILLPSGHKPEGNGLNFPTVHDTQKHKDEWP